MQTTLVVVGARIGASRRQGVGGRPSCGNGAALLKSQQPGPNSRSSLEIENYSLKTCIRALVCQIIMTKRQRRKFLNAATVLCKYGCQISWSQPWLVKALLAAPFFPGGIVACRLLPSGDPQTPGRLPAPTAAIRVVCLQDQL